MCALCSHQLSALGVCLISRMLNHIYWTHYRVDVPLKFPSFHVAVSRLRQSRSFAIRFTVSFASLSSIADDSTIAAGTAVIYIPTCWNRIVCNELFIFLLSIVSMFSIMCGGMRACVCVRSVYSLNSPFGASLFTHAAHTPNAKHARDKHQSMTKRKDSASNYLLASLLALSWHENQVLSRRTHELYRLCVALANVTVNRLRNCPITANFIIKSTTFNLVKSSEKRTTDTHRNVVAAVAAIASGVIRTK